MKLNTNQQAIVETQVGIEAIPDEHPANEPLRDAFGNHTFFLDATGLKIVEQDPSPETSNGNVVQLARWKDENLRELVRHEPEVMPEPIALTPEEPDSTA